MPLAAGAHEAPELRFGSDSLLRRLLLKRAERPELTLSFHDPLNGGVTKRTDQLVLQVGHANVEAEWLHVGTSQIRAEAGPLEARWNSRSSPASHMPASRRHRPFAGTTATV